jgi:hypothetical protein
MNIKELLKLKRKEEEDEENGRTQFYQRQISFIIILTVRFTRPKVKESPFSFKTRLLLKAYNKIP